MDQLKRLNGILRHVEDVRRDTQIVGEALIARGEFELGKALIANGRVHDQSKLSGVEWRHLGSRGGHLHEFAWAHHVARNLHHPEAWVRDGVVIDDTGRTFLADKALRPGIHRMPPAYVAEMVCDWHSRSSEFGTDFWGWVEGKAAERYGFTREDPVYSLIKDFAGLLLEERF